MTNEEYLHFQAAVVPNNPDRYISPTINLICRPKRLRNRISELQQEERVKVTKVFNDQGHEVPKEQWQ